MIPSLPECPLWDVNKKIKFYVTCEKDKKSNNYEKQIW